MDIIDEKQACMEDMECVYEANIVQFIVESK